MKTIIMFLAAVVVTGPAVQADNPLVYVSPTNDSAPAAGHFTNLIAVPAITNWPATNLPAMTNPPAVQTPDDP
jgi:hypothetical protein